MPTLVIEGTEHGLVVVHRANCVGWCASDTYRPVRDDRGQYLTTKICCSILGHLCSTHHVITAKVGSCGKVDYSNYLKDDFRPIGRYAVIFINIYIGPPSKLYL